MTDALRPEDFSSFFHGLHDYEAFPWQQRLATRVCNDGHFPKVADLPTGSGKTSLIEIALFHLAYDLGRGGERRAPLRIVWVVDRRLIVDEAYDRAVSIAEKLDSADSGTLGKVADILRGAFDDGPLLVAQRLRGGMPLEGDWARTPAQPTIVSTTVDQVGSRLLFRGYGVSARMRPVHAGLLGEDALIVLDEVHLAEPFRQTLAAISERRVAGHALHTPWQYVELSATPRDTARKEVFRLDDEDDWRHPKLVKRLSHPKFASLRELGRIPFGSDKHAEAFAEEAVSRSGCGDGGDAVPKSVLVVVNRVDLARRVYNAIKERLAKREDKRCGITLLIGRNRDISKDCIREKILAHSKSEVKEESWRAKGRPFIAVSTQSIEAGADLDFDVLVTQIASLDALRQRFGRHNRMGHLPSAEGVILAVDSEIVASAKPDIIYGDALRETWRWLEEKAIDRKVNFAASDLKTSEADEERLSSPRCDAPKLMPQHVEALARTNPPPTWSPDPALYLHGREGLDGEVNVVWRADIPEVDDGLPEALIANLLSLVPPRRAEAVSVPIAAARRWLRRERPAITLSDIDAPAETDEVTKVQHRERHAWRWTNVRRETRGQRGKQRRYGHTGTVERVYANDLRPGNTIVVPSSYGGCDQYGWNPSGSDPVRDVALEAAQPYSRRSYALRLHRDLFGQEIRTEDPEEHATWTPVAAAIKDHREDRGARLLVEALVGNDESPGPKIPDTWRDALTALRDRSKGGLSLEFAYRMGDDDDGSGPGVVIYARNGIKPSPDESRRRFVGDSATEDDAAGLQSDTGDPCTLMEHGEAVAKKVREYQGMLGLADGLADDLALAARLHNVGKSDLRFQRFLAGDYWTPLDKVLAKSGGRKTRREETTAWELSRLPARWRHEALSVRIAMKHPELTKANDPELVLWLIGTHHGFGRPVFPHDDERDDDVSILFGFEPYGDRERALHLGAFPGPQRVDFMLPVGNEGAPLVVDWQTMFSRLERRYGTWGLAWLESILRLADHRASEAGDAASAKAST